MFPGIYRLWVLMTRTFAPMSRLRSQPLGRTCIHLDEWPPRSLLPWSMTQITCLSMWIYRRYSCPGPPVGLGAPFNYKGVKVNSRLRILCSVCMCRIEQRKSIRRIRNETDWSSLGDDVVGSICGFGPASADWRPWRYRYGHP